MVILISFNCILFLQIFSSRTGDISHRVVSCCCIAPSQCQCYAPKVAVLTDHDTEAVAVPGNIPQLTNSLQPVPSGTLGGKYI